MPSVDVVNTERHPRRHLLTAVLGIVAVLALALAITRAQSFFQYLAATQLTQKGVEFVFEERPKGQSRWARIIYGNDNYDFVTHIKVDGIVLTSSDIACLDNFPRLKAVYLYTCPSADEVLLASGKMRSLERMAIFNADISSRSLRKLGELPTLRSLELSDVTITDFDSRHIPRFSSIEYLTCTGKSGNDQAILIAAQCPKLRILNLMNASISDNGLIPLQNAVSLESLSITNAPITGKTLDVLSGCSHMRRLCLRGCAIDDTGLSTFKQIGGLKEIQLESTRVTEEGIMAFKQALPHCKVESDF